MNVNRLQPATPPQVRRVSKEAEEKDTDFFALRLLNKRGRVRLSEQSHKLENLPARGVLFATANSKGCFAAAICSASGQHSVILSGLRELRNAFASSEDGSEIPFTPRRTVNLPAQPHVVCFASNDSRLLVGFVEGSVAVYDTNVLCTHGSEAVQPLYVLNSPTGTAPREVMPNPGDVPDLVAILYEPGGTPDSPRVVLLDVQKQQVAGGWTPGSTERTIPTALSWSPRGKQLAIGMQSGDIVTYAPGDTATMKTMVPHPEWIRGSVLAASWLSNPDFHCIYAQPATPITTETEQVHVLVSWDSKTGTASEVKLGAPYLPIPGLRPPGSFVIALRQWEPSKFLLFIGDGTSSDIGLIGCVPDAGGNEEWINFTMEENSTPSVPLDQDMNDTVLVGLALDLTATDGFAHKTASGEDCVLPPPPIMYAYASDGTIVGWNLLNTVGKPYPGMVSGQGVADFMETSVDMDAKPSEPAPVQPSPFAQVTSPQPSAAQPTSGFGQPSPAPAFAQSAFGQPSGFGKPAFGGGASTSAFGSPNTGGGGFAGFANAGPAKFGQSAFATSGPSQPAAASLAPPPIAVSTSITMGNAEDPMSADTSANAGLGGLSLGDEKPPSNADKEKSAGIFGAPQPTPESASPAFGSSGAFGSAIKPATGFGAFSNITTTPSAFGGNFSISSTGDNSSATPPKPSPAFGSTGFGSTPTTTPPASGFGQSSFGSKPAFGQSAFGQSAFGGSPTPNPATASSTSPLSSGGGFSAFAKGTSAFGAAAQAGTSVFGKSTPKSPEPKPAPEATAKASEPTNMTAESKPEVPALASSSAGTSMFGGANAAPVTPRKSTSAFGAPNTPPSSAENSPVITPTPTPVFAAKSSTPAPTTGAFANLQSSPLGFGKLAAGHGAFGASSTASSSPFYNPPKAPVVSAFGGTPPALAATPATPPSGSSKPVFGAHSAFGSPASPSKPESAFGSPSPFGKSAFGTPTVKSAFAPIGSASSVPSAFSNFTGSGGFGSAASGEKKSFSELLKSEKDKDATASSATAPKSVFSKAPTPSGSAFASRPANDARDGDDDDDDEEGTSEPGEEPLEHPDDGEDDDALSFISEPIEEYEEEEEEEEEGADEADDEDDDGDLEEVPIRDGSEGLAFPGTEGATVTMPPTIHLTDSSPPNVPQPLKEEKTTTPPGSPDEKPAASSSKPPATPSPFGIGLGRPSTRPTRSSPLASAPISGDDDSDEDKTERLPPLKAPGLPTKGLSPSPKPEPSASPKLSPVSSRPKTPPPLSAFAPPKPSPFTLAPSAFGTPSPVVTTPAPTKVAPLFGASQTAATATKPTSATTSTPSPFAQPKATTTAAAGGPVPFFATPPGPLFPPKSNATPPPTGGITTPAGGLFGQKPPVAAPPVPLPPGGLFGQKPPGAPAGGLFGQKTPTPPPSGAPAGSLFGQKPPAAAPATAPQSAFGRPAGPSTSAFGPKQPAAPVPGGAPAPSAQPPRPSLRQDLENWDDGMQKETVLLILNIARDIARTEKLAAECKVKRTELSATSAQLGLLTESIEKLQAELSKSKRGNGKYKAACVQLDSALLKARMRKEEIERFSKASNDAEFAKMMKSRTLDPEHLEIQTQLRRGIRVLRDRIQKLEDTLQESKKRVNQLKAGKAGIKAPSLDTIGRTYKNIDIAISRQAEDVSKLAGRMSRLDLKSLSDQRLNFKGKRSSNVAPDVAAATAATLNAERSAQKLKGALLKARRQPLLNTQALHAPPPTMEDVPKLEKKVEEKKAGPADVPLPSMPKSLPPFQLPPREAFVPPVGSPGSSHGSPVPAGPLAYSGPERAKKHHDKAPVLKRSAGTVGESMLIAPTPVAVPAGFSWGPVPPPKSGPVNALPFSFSLSTSTKKEEPQVKEEPKEPPSLSGSWVADGFGNK